MIKLSVDAMGGDLGSGIVVEAVNQFVQDYPDVEIKLVGKSNELSMSQTSERITIIDAPNVMEMDESIYRLIEKQDASIVRAATLVKEGQADALITCGSTPAFVGAATMIIKRIKGIQRAALTTIFPTPNKVGFMLIDMGANTECSPEHLMQFAMMANVYSKQVRHIKKPRIALLNNGTEDTKGDALRKETFKLLKASNLHFIGNIEGKQIMSETFDVVVCDGFTGNIALKTMEGTMKGFSQLLKQEIMATMTGKIGGLLLKKTMKRVKDHLDDRAVGGALLLGLNAPAVKAHGSSDAFAFYHAMKLAYEAAKQDVVSQIKEGLQDGH